MRVKMGHMDSFGGASRSKHTGVGTSILIVTLSIAGLHQALAFSSKILLSPSSIHLSNHITGTRNKDSAFTSSCQVKNGGIQTTQLKSLPQFVASMQRKRASQRKQPKKDNDEEHSGELDSAVGKEVTEKEETVTGKSDNYNDMLQRMNSETLEVVSSPQDRFHRVASNEASIETPAILTIHNKQYNMTAWAKSHPGGAAVLKKFHGKDATMAFEKSGHSKYAYALLREFEIPSETTANGGSEDTPTTDAKPPPGPSKNIIGQDKELGSLESEKIPTWRRKLFTTEDPIGVHKVFGVYVLLHFAYRIGRMMFGDPAAGLAVPNSRKFTSALLPMLCVLPHGILSMSSMIFHTVPRERVVGKPMIWQEFRAHNIIFGLRSVVCTILAWSSFYFDHSPLIRKIALVGSGTTILASNALADMATDRLRENTYESTTATMPYWEGCSVQTQRRFKSFYAYSQFMATIACLAVGNPAWPFSVLLAIQLASLLMTLVRKSLISTKAYHYTYTAALVVPYLVALRDGFLVGKMKVWEVPGLFALGGLLYQLRRRGINKFVLWAPVVLARVILGDQFMSWKVW